MQIQSVTPPVPPDLTPPASPLEPPLHLTIGPSRALSIVLLTGHIAIMVSLPMARPDWAGWLMLLCWPVLGLSLIRSMALHARRAGAAAVIALEATTDGRVRAVRRDGGRFEGRVLGSSTVHPWLVVLNLRPVQDSVWRIWPHSVIIVRDACDRDAFRRLRVWLRWGHREGVEEHDPPA